MPSLESIDLDRVLALHWLLEEAHVSRAARRMSTSQPAMSRTLSALRDLLGDPLLVRSGRAMVRTPFADALRPRLSVAVTELRTVLRDPEPFSPETATGAFRVAITDYAATLVITAWNACVRPEAPRLDLELVPFGPTTAEEGIRGELDLAIAGTGVPGIDDRYVVKPFLAETFVSVVRRGHALSRHKVSLSRFAALDHVLVVTGSGQVSSVDRKLQSRGLARRIALRVPSFWTALHAVRDSDAVTTLPKRFVDIAGPDITVLRLADEIPGFSLDLVWHPRNTTSPRHRFVREALLRWAGKL
ncbi:MAG: LysR family transcriptional regulator [Deltaproteobacteria bacterium]|nr:LysR family transcriptional regulator [Deltaproteobacteria bacterium]MBW2686562.1 LysR family transcriptional regulator [Deltaproteobacteria bacterium]